MKFRPLPPAALFAPLLALLAGALNVLAFAPFSLWPLQILTLALAFHLLQRETSIRRSALIGWAYGFGCMVGGIHWLYISMHRYGGMPGWMAALAVVMLALCLGLFAALALGGASWLLRRLTASRSVALLLILPASWALTEWLRSWVFTGFPWLASGYAHNVSPLAGFAPLIGVIGVGWLAALSAGCIALLPSRKPAALLIAIMAGGLGLQAVDWSQPHGQPIKVRLLQGNVAQELKFNGDETSRSLALYRDLIDTVPADLIVTPETAIPLFAQQLPPDYLPRLAEFARQSGSHLLLGIPLNDTPQRYTNSVLGISPNSQQLATLYRYDKHHLVPFGEFIPTGFHWFVDLMRIPLGDFTRGARLQEPFAVKDQWVLPNICYEDLFGEAIADQLAVSHVAGTPLATMLLNMSNIAWFGDTIALPQHLQISQMRALETARPMLRATNTGTTAVIDPKGRVLAQLKPYTTGTLAFTLQGYQGTTPYIVMGNYFIVALCLILLLLPILLSRRTRQEK